MRYFYLAFVVIFFLSYNANAQQNITLQLIEPPGEELPLDESLRAVITNNTQEPVEVYLKGFVNEAEEGLIFEGYSSVFVLEDPVTTIDRRNLEPLEPVETQFTDSDYKDYITRTSEFPPGDYEVCVRVIVASGDEVVAEDCYEKSVQEYLPPSLISPENGMTVYKKQPFFTWSPVPGSNGGNISYELGIVEMVGNQSPVSAFESNPIWFGESGINSPLFRYPIAAREFEEEQSYAWKVSAYVGSNKVTESEVWSFTYKADTTGSEEEEDEDEEQEEEMLIPKQYVKLSPESGTGFYLLENYQLRFIYKNKYASSKIKCHLENRRNEIIARDILSEKQKSGLNFNELDMTSKVEPGKKYLLRCIGPLGQEKGLRFQVRKESSENIIDDLNLGDDLIDFQEGILNGGG